jgi:Lar family restriction alleviation protein
VSEKKIKLKPCPFCGGKASLTDIILGAISVTCVKCWARTVMMPTKAEAVNAWNKRSEK